MSETSFGNLDETEVAKTDVATNTPSGSNLPAAQPSSAIVGDEFFENDGFGEELDAKQVGVPFLSLAHGVGGLAKAGFIPGSLVYDSRAVVLEPKRGSLAILPEDGATIYMLGGLGPLDYMEKITNEQYEAGVKPRVFANEAEARAAGLGYGKDVRAGKATAAFTPRLRVKILIETKEPSLGFPIEIEGVKDRSFALAALILTGGNYWGAGKDLYKGVNTYRQLALKPWWTAWKLYTQFKTAPGATNGAWAMYVKQASKTEEAIKTFLAEKKF